MSTVPGGRMCKSTGSWPEAQSLGRVHMGFSSHRFRKPGVWVKCKVEERNHLFKCQVKGGFNKERLQQVLLRFSWSEAGRQA